MGEVFVIVARDSTIKKIKKKNPTIPEKQRLAVIQAIKQVSFATLGNENNNFIKKALDLNPNIILLGPNQRIHTDYLQKILLKHNADHIQVKRVDKFYSDYPLTSSSAIKKKIKEEF